MVAPFYLDFAGRRLRQWYERHERDARMDRTFRDVMREGARIWSDRLEAPKHHELALNTLGMTLLVVSFALKLASSPPAGAG